MTRADERSRSARSGRSTELTIRDARAAIVHDELLRHPEHYLTTDDVPHMPRLTRWNVAIVVAAIADLVADGLLTEAADGRLCVRPRPTA